MRVEARQEGDRLDRRRQQPGGPPEQPRAGEIQQPQRERPEHRRGDPRELVHGRRVAVEVADDAVAAAVDEREQEVQQVRERRRVGEVVRVQRAVAEHRSPPAARSGRLRRCCRRTAAPGGSPTGAARGPPPARPPAHPRPPGAPSSRPGARSRGGVRRRGARAGGPCTRRRPAAGSAVGIDGVVAARVDAPEVLRRDLVERDRRRRRRSPREHRAAERVDRHAAAPSAAAASSRRPRSASLRAWLRATMSCWPTLSRIQRASGISLLLGSDSSGQRRSAAATFGLVQRRPRAPGGSPRARPAWCAGSRG